MCLFTFFGVGEEWFLFFGGDTVNGLDFLLFFLGAV